MLLGRSPCGRSQKKEAGKNYDLRKIVLKPWMAQHDETTSRPSKPHLTAHTSGEESPSGFAFTEQVREALVYAFDGVEELVNP